MKLIFEGLVQKVHPELLYYEVGETRVFLDFDVEPPLIPVLGTHVKFSSSKELSQLNRNIFLCKSTSVEYEEATCLDNKLGLELLAILKHRDKGLSDSFLINEIIGQISANVECSDDTLSLCVLQIFKINHGNGSVTSKAIPDTEERNQFKVTFCNNLRYVNKHSEIYSEILGPMDVSTCLQGYYPFLKNTYLIGILTVDKLCGRFILKDKNHQIPIIFKKNVNPECTGEALAVIDSWTVFVEAFFQPSSENQEFILLDNSYIHIVTLLEEAEEKRLPLNLKYQPLPDCLETKILIIQRSMPIIGYHGIPQVWLDVAILNETVSTREKYAFYILEENHFPMAIYLKENHEYMLQHKKSFQSIPTNDIAELKKLKMGRKTYIISQETIFNELEKNVSATPPSFESLKSLKHFITSGKQNYSIVSFSGVIYKKSLRKINYQNYIKKRHNFTCYGNPGLNTQIVLTFKTEENTMFDLYLVEDNSVAALGLIKNMNVKVNNVMIMSSKYLKSIAPTNFEIIEFKVDMVYRSVSLKIPDKNNWQPFQEELSLIEDNPSVAPYTVVTGLLYILQVLELRIKTIESNRMGSHNLKVFCCLLVKGTSAKTTEFNITSCDISVLDVIFKLRTHGEKKALIDSFLKCEAFIFKSCNEADKSHQVRERKLQDKECFIEDVTEYLNTFNNEDLKGGILVQAVCMKENENVLRRKEYKVSWHVNRFNVLE